MKVLCGILLLTLSVSIFGQAKITGSNNTIETSCLPDGIILSIQEEIDDFTTNYPDCTEILGYVIVHGATITNLNGLLGLQSIGSFLH